MKFSEKFLLLGRQNSSTGVEENNVENNVARKDSFSPVSGSVKNLSEHNKDGEFKGNPTDNKGKRSFFKACLYFIWELLKIVIIATIIVLPIRYFLFQPFIVKGDSMVPNLHSGDYLIIDEFSYRFSDPQRGDVVVLKYPLDTTQRFIKRIIGLPGETVEIKNGKIEILSSQCGIPSAGKNCQGLPLIEETYLPLPLNTSGDINVTLGADTYFVLGDNRPYSYDSRLWGALPREDIVGKAFFRVFPLSAITIIKTPNY